MGSPILMPDLGGGPIHLSSWLVHPGEHVYEGDRIVEVLLDGATFDIPSPCTGTLLDRQALTNDLLETGQVLGHVQEDSA